MKLYHITLNTGHARWSERSEVQPGLLTQLGPLVTQCEREHSVEVPTPSGLMLLSSLQPETPSRHVAVWTIRHPGGPALATWAVGMRARPAAGLWRQLHEHARDVVTRADDAPPAPWLAAWLHALLYMTPEGFVPWVHWLGDFERCVAWAWIDEVWHAQSDH